MPTIHSARFGILLGLFLLGCGAGPTGQPTFAGDVLLDPQRPGPRPLEQALGPNGHHVIFVNFDGVTLGPNYDDSIHNQSSIVGQTGHSVTIPPFNAALYSNQKSRAQVIADVMALVSTYYAAFNVDLVATRPAQPNYVMCAVGGLPDLIGYPCNQQGCVGGIAPLDCQTDQNGKIYYNTQDDIEVVFAFSDTAKYDQGLPYGAKIQTVAATIAQETAHAYGLGHENDPKDVMYPQTAGSTVGFLDVASPYADNQNCARGQGTQNSYKLLLQILGAHMGGMNPPTDTTAPTVAFTAPTAGSTVGRSINVALDASDDVGVTSVQVVISGPNNWSQTKSLGGAPWTWAVTVPSDGAYTLTATAGDLAGNAGTATDSFLVKSGSPSPFGSKCSANTDCQSGLCSNGVCTQSCGVCPSGYTCGANHVCVVGGTMMNPGDVGATCMTSSDCKMSYPCAEYDGQHFCTKPCDPNDPNSCPAPLYCGSAGADGNYCLYPPTTVPVARGGSSCAIAARASSTTGPTPIAALAFALLTLARRRRRA